MPNKPVQVPSFLIQKFIRKPKNILVQDTYMVPLAQIILIAPDLPNTFSKNQFQNQFQELLKHNIAALRKFQKTVLKKVI